MTDDLPQAFAQHWRELDGVEWIRRITGGEAKDVFRLDAADGSYVLRVYPPDVSAQDVASELALTERLAERVPAVPAAIATRRGALQATEGGRAAVLTTFIEGARPERSRDPARNRAAAETLARLHDAAAALDAPPARAGYAPYRDLDWHTNRWWSWPDVARYLRAQTDDDAPRTHRRLEEELPRLEDRLATLGALDLPSLPIHNDYYRSNLLEHDGRIAGIVDWDEFAIDWRALELANAACEFARDDEYRFHPAVARAFLDAYLAAGGELFDREIEALVPLRGLRLLWETLYELGRACRGATPGWGYLWDNLASLDGFARLY